MKNTLSKKIIAVLCSLFTLCASFNCAAAAPQTAMAYTNADKVVDYAKSKTYITSRPNEVTDFWGVVCDWCSMFVYYCAYQTGFASSVPKASFCDSQYGVTGGVEIFKKWNKWQYSQYKGGNYVPKKGDIIYFDWDMDGWSDHVGFVDYVESKYVHTVEGNAGTYGDCVKLNKFPLNYANILGYGLPDYTAQSVSQPVSTPVTSKTTTKTTMKTTAKPAATTVKTTAAVNYPAVYMVSNPEGSWLRTDCNTNASKYGILSTGQLIVVDGEKNGWAHVVNAEVEDRDGTFSGWAYMENLKFISSSYVTASSKTTESAAPAKTTEKPAEKVTEPVKQTIVIKVTNAPVKETTAAENTTTAAETTSDVKTTSAVKVTMTPVTSAKNVHVVEVKPSPSRDAVHDDGYVADTYELRSISYLKGAWFVTVPANGIGLSVAFLDGSELAELHEIQGDRLYADVSRDGGETVEYGYILLSTVKRTAVDKSADKTMYRVTSSIGCRVRSTPDTDSDNTVWILNTNDVFEVTSVDGDWAEARITIGTDSEITGFVHISNIAKV